MLTLTPQADKLPKIFLRVANGQIIAKMGVDKISFDTVSGAITNIELKQHTFENKRFFNWHVNMVDTRTGEAYDMSFGRTSGVFRTIVRCLASDEGLSSLNDIEIHVYKPRYGNFTNAVVNGHGKKLNWIPESVPPVLYRKLDGTTVPDYSLRNDWVDEMVERINEAAKHTLLLDASSIDEDMSENIC